MGGGTQTKASFDLFADGDLAENSYRESPHLQLMFLFKPDWSLLAWAPLTVTIFGHPALEPRPSCFSDMKAFVCVCSLARSRHPCGAGGGAHVETCS